jgi:Icc-related predicted phosphoesterase
LNGTKIFFATDLHGGETYFGKILSVAKTYNVDVLLISGDLTGKAIVPIVQLADDRYVTNFFGERSVSEKELPELEKEIRRVGYYYMVCNRGEYEELKAEPGRIDKLFDKLMRDTVENWIRRIREILPKEMRVIMNPGNDDSFVVDDALKQSDRTEYTIGKITELDAWHSLVSCEWVNPTPWSSPRECSEKELEKRLRSETSRASDTQHLICDFHAPPYNTPLDSAPKLGSDLKPKLFMGQPIFEHVGSKAVRNVFEDIQPKLGLHGHIHESAGQCKIGKTLCVNAGSEYVEGIMHGCLITLTEEKVDYQPIIGG